MVRLLAFSGSARTGSFNQQLVDLATAKARALGAEVTAVKLTDFDLPLFNEDLEKDPGPPADVARWRHTLMDHDGFLIACPEYNGSITPLLKNAIDWATRPEEGVAPLAAYQGKTATLLAASPGALGGIRGLAHVRTILSGIGTIVLPTQVAVGAAHQAFTDDGSALQNERTEKMLQMAVEQCVQRTRALASATAQAK